MTTVAVPSDWVVSVHASPDRSLHIANRDWSADLDPRTLCGRLVVEARTRGSFVASGCLDCAEALSAAGVHAFWEHHIAVNLRRFVQRRGR